jgi:aarF domain-containing kinase
MGAARCVKVQGKKRMLRTFSRRSAAAVAIGSGATAVYAYSDSGFRRQCKFWITVGPTAAHYVACSMMHKKSDAAARSQEFAKLHKKYAPVSLDLILSLRGLYIKFGQAAASSPFVPDAYRTQFKQLESDVPSEDFESIKKVIEEELGPMDRLFAHFSPAACGAASTGQAHVAKLHTGEDVVVKVQYPDAAAIFSADMQCLRALIRLANPEALPAFSEFEAQLALELDYRQELRNLDAIFGAVMPRYADRVAVPVIAPDCARLRLIASDCV